MVRDSLGAGKQGAGRVSCSFHALKPESGVTLSLSFSIRFLDFTVGYLLLTK